MAPSPRLLLLAATLLAAGCGSAGSPPSTSGAPGAPPRAAPQATDPGLVGSNVLRGDYAGSKACAPCHAELYARWSASPMRRMTRLADEAQIQAPFDGKVFPFKGDTVALEQHEGRRYMRVASQRSGDHLYRVTKVIGGRYREDFAGYEVAGIEASASPLGNPHKEPVLPVSWLIFSQSLRYKGYSVMVKERPYIEKGGAPWAETCIFCHNTTPYLSTIYDDLSTGPSRAYQGSISDRLLPESKLWRARVVDEGGLRQALGAEIGLLTKKPPPAAGGTVDELLGEAIKVTSRRFDEGDLVEVGIGCEACHNGSREHVVDPRRKPTFAIRSAVVGVDAPGHDGAAPGKAEWINHTCARCHTVLFSRYPYTWEGGLRAGPAGGSTINSGEARDFLLGGCSSKMACTACHDPHAEDSREKLDALGTVAGNHVCTGCHPALAETGALAAHTHHAPAGEGSACLGCHMPRKNTGLGNRLTRYHRIGSPTDKDRVEKDRPLECALCHVDRSTASLVATMEAWWSKKYDHAALAALYGGELEQSPILPTLARGKPHEQITAAGVAGERSVRAAAPLLVPLLSSEYPLVRYSARGALERIYGRPLGVDLDGDSDAIQRGARAWLVEAPRP